MTRIAYTLEQLAADLAAFGYAGCEQLTMKGLGQRYANRLRAAQSAVDESSAEPAAALDAARDRLREWDHAGRPALEGTEAQPGFAETTAEAAIRAAARQAAFQEAETARVEQQRQEEAERLKALRALNRIFFWRRWKRRAMVPLRGLAWAFAHLPTERVPWVVVGLLLTFGWPFLQDSSYGQYVPRMPSIYQWFRNTEAIRWLGTGGQGPWVNHGARR